jgi:hypothetical protein
MPTIAAQVFALRLLIDYGEDLFEPVDMSFGFATMLFESRLEFGALGRLGHFREGAQNLLFSEIDVLQSVVVSGCRMTANPPRRL